MYSKNKKAQKYNKKAIILFSIVAITAIGLVVYGLNRHNNQRIETATTSGIQEVDENIAYAPASEEERQQVADNKERIVNELSKDDALEQGERAVVSPIITSSQLINNTLEVRGYVAGVVEDGGTCALAISRGSERIVRTTQGIADATTTICEPFAITASEFDFSAPANIILTYQSDRAQGTSQTINTGGSVHD